MKNYKSVSLYCFGLGVLDNLIISNLGVKKDYIKIKLPIIDVSNVLLTRPRYTDVCSKNIFSDLCDGYSWPFVVTSAVKLSCIPSMWQRMVTSCPVASLIITNNGLKELLQIMYEGATYR